MRGIIAAIVDSAEDISTADMEAGLEHLSRGTTRHADAVIAILEPYYRSLETGARVLEMAKELGVKRVHAIANKVRGPADQQAIDEFCKARGISLLGSVPHDDAVLEADREGGAILDRAPDGPAVRAITAIANELMA